jgi:hypothetical protein
MGVPTLGLQTLAAMGLFLLLLRVAMKGLPSFFSQQARHLMLPTRRDALRCIWLPCEDVRTLWSCCWAQALTHMWPTLAAGRPSSLLVRRHNAGQLRWRYWRRMAALG